MEVAAVPERSTEVSNSQSVNALLPMLVSAFGKETDSKVLQFLKVPSLTDVICVRQ